MSDYVRGREGIGKPDDGRPTKSTNGIAPLGFFANAAMALHGARCPKGCRQLQSIPWRQNLLGTRLLQQLLRPIDAIRAAVHLEMGVVRLHQLKEAIPPDPAKTGEKIL